MASYPAAAAAAAPAAAGAARPRKRSAAEAELGDDDQMDPRLEARIARYAAGSQSQSRRSVLIGRRSKNARRPSDADLNLSFDDAPAASPPGPPAARQAAAAAPWVDLTEDDDSPGVRAAASFPARAAAQPSRARAAVEVLSSGSDDDTPLAEVGTRPVRGGRRRDLSWMVPPEPSAMRVSRGDGTRRHRRRNDPTNRNGGRARNGASSGDVSGAGASGQPDMDTDARLARQLQQQEDEQARRMYQQHHRQQWQLQRQSMQDELEDLQDEEEHYQQRQGFAESWAARMAGVASSLGLGGNFRNLFQSPDGDAPWRAAGHNGPPGRGRGRGAAAASLQHRELTEEDYEELSRLDEGSAGASKELINSVIKTKLKNDHDDDCCICMDQMKKNTLVRILPCTHTFHSRCADKWLKQKNSCPMCQRPIDASE
jgi:hypothetical protein